MRFRILRGRHQSGNKQSGLSNYSAPHPITGQPKLDSEGNQLSDIIETDLDLVKMFGAKFQKLTDEPVTTKG